MTYEPRMAGNEGVTPPKPVSQQMRERYSPHFAKAAAEVAKTEDEVHHELLKADVTATGVAGAVAHGKPQVHNRDGMSEHDLSGVESVRYYDKLVELPSGKTQLVVYTIQDPVKLYVKRRQQGDSHRVVDAKGTTHYIDGWHAIRWLSKDGKDGVTF